MYMYIYTYSNTCTCIDHTACFEWYNNILVPIITNFGTFIHYPV